jgi:hypothetical protein
MPTILEWIDKPELPGILAVANPSPKTSYRIMQQTETTYLLACIVKVGAGFNNYNAGQDFSTIEEAKVVAQTDWNLGIRL